MSPWPLRTVTGVFTSATCTLTLACLSLGGNCTSMPGFGAIGPEDRKSTRLNSSHVAISYAVFCLKKKKSYLMSIDRYEESAAGRLRQRDYDRRVLRAAERVHDSIPR